MDKHIEKSYKFLKQFKSKKIILLFSITLVFTYLYRKIYIHLLNNLGLLEINGYFNFGPIMIKKKFTYKNLFLIVFYLLYLILSTVFKLIKKKLKR